MKKERLDILLVKKGLTNTREKSKKIIMSGVVFVNNNKEDKPGTKINEDSKIEIKGSIHPYVSRGGLKIEKAFKEFGFSLGGKFCYDIGSSTGGFTHFMLLNGAEKVIAIDVGYGQLAWSLRTDTRVIVKERTNARYLKPEDVEFQADFVSIDVSFISLRKILPAIWNLIKDNAEVICLIKPQFETQRDKVGKNGVVKEKNVHIDVIKNIVLFCIDNKWLVKGFTYSSIKGPEGNIEYLIYLEKIQSDNLKNELEEYNKEINKTVDEAHNNLKKLTPNR
ncbi:MAG: TlyA family RNA methyltransferase [Clostridiales bacterium]